MAVAAVRDEYEAAHTDSMDARLAEASSAAAAAATEAANVAARAAAEVATEAAAAAVAEAAAEAEGAAAVAAAKILGLNTAAADMASAHIKQLSAGLDSTRNAFGGAVVEQARHATEVESMRERFQSLLDDGQEKLAAEVAKNERLNILGTRATELVKTNKHGYNAAMAAAAQGVRADKAEDQYKVAYVLENALEVGQCRLTPG